MKKRVTLSETERIRIRAMQTIPILRSCLRERLDIILALDTSGGHAVADYRVSRAFGFPSSSVSAVKARFLRGGLPALMGDAFPLCLNTRQLLDLVAHICAPIPEGLAAECEAEKARRARAGLPGLEQDLYPLYANPEHDAATPRDYRKPNPNGWSWELLSFWTGRVYGCRVPAWYLRRQLVKAFHGTLADAGMAQRLRLSDPLVEEKEQEFLRRVDELRAAGDPVSCDALIPILSEIRGTEQKEFHVLEVLAFHGRSLDGLFPETS